MNGTTSTHHPSLEDKILSHLQRRRSRSGSNEAFAATRKEIQKEFVAKNACDVSKKDVKRALKRLVKRGDIVKDGKKYKIILSSASSSSSSSADDENDSDDDSRSHDSSALDDDKNVYEGKDELRGGGVETAVAPLVPIAERLRQTAQAERSEDNSNLNQKIDLEEEIRRLEAELAESDNDDDDDENSNYDDDSSSDDDHSTDQNITSHSDGIICLSSVADERIIPLPQGALPQNKRRTLKNIDSGDGELPKKKKSKKQKHTSSTTTSKEEHAISEGLKDAVNELLSNYVPSSHLKKPFYCRVCQHQSTSESDFLSHKQSEFHKGAVQQEKKRTYCKLCRKQLTSIVQMGEHLKSRPHREKMDFVKSKQSGGGGRGRSRGHHGRDASGKQWC